MNDLNIPPNLYHQAINAAMDCRWHDALKINKQINKTDPENIDALNRQAKAYLELGKLNLAKKYYTLALKVDPYNSIAQKNLKIIKASSKNGFHQNSSGVPNGSLRLSPLLFLQEPGKTKVVSLLKVAEPQKLSLVYPGMIVKIQIKNHRLHIVDGVDSYLGVLPDDLSFQLLRLIKGGNRYEVYVKSVKVNGLSVLLKETFRSKKFKEQPSFLDAGNSVTSTDIITSLSEDDEPEEPDESDEPEI